MKDKDKKRIMNRLKHWKKIKDVAELKISMLEQDKKELTNRRLR